MVWLGVIIAGALGALSRWLTGHVVARWPDPPWTAWGTTTANLLGCALMGLIDRLAAVGVLDPLWTTILGVGFVGAYTTYSSWVFELAELVRARAFQRMAQILLVNLGGGVVLYAVVRFA
ncbi:MAG: CrcB family protein [Firmicutes bacterium]|nr:CrcB family protein [Bacillota bacterium]